MKLWAKISLVVFLIGNTFSSFSQLPWTADFGTGCSTGTLATSIGWTQTLTGLNEADPNIWYVSAAEQGLTAGGCGIGCGGTNSRSLHISAPVIGGGDLGAAYLETSPLFCGFGFCAATDKRIESPTIDCSSQTNIPITFDYIENGEGALDNATLWYSANDGTTWTQIDDMPKTPLCGGGQGQWTSRSLTLPASADNNPTVKIGFRWVNNANGVGTDPSVAIDNIVVGVVLLPIELSSFEASCNERANQINWTTESELNNDYFIIHYSLDGHNWEYLDDIKGAGTSKSQKKYEIVDLENHGKPVYYMLEQVDFDGSSTQHQIVFVEPCTNQLTVQLYPNPSAGQLKISSSENVNEIEISNLNGQLIYAQQILSKSKTLSISPSLENGIYLLNVRTKIGSKTIKLIIKK